jgi:hypothetical protein
VYADADGSTSKLAGRSTDAARPQSIPRTGEPEGSAGTAEVDGAVVGEVAPHPAAIAAVTARIRTPADQLPRRRRPA